MYKYDKKCHLYVNAANVIAGKKDHESEKGTSISENRDEFLAVIIGQLIRLFAKSKSMSVGFCNFATLERIV